MLAVAFGVICLYGLLSGFGTNLGLAYVNFHLPLINKIREAGRHLVLFVIGVSFLSGLGYSLLAQRLEQYKQRGNISSLITPTVLGLTFAGIIVWELLQNAQGGSRTGFWMLAVAPILFLIGRACKLARYKDIASAAGAFRSPQWSFRSGESQFRSQTFDKPLNLLSHRVLQSMAPKIDRDYRVDFRDKAFSNRFWAMNASYYGIKSFYNQIPPQPYDQFRFSNLTDIPHLCEMMGARYVLCGPDSSPLDQNAQPILDIEGYRMYENASPMGALDLGASSCRPHE